MSKTIIYDRDLKNHVVVNEDGSLNVKVEGMDISAGDTEINLDGVKVQVDESSVVLTRSYNGIESTDYKLNEPHHYIAVANDSKESKITLLVNGLSIDVLPWESFEAEFEPFQEFTVEDEDKVDFRVAVFQKKKEVNDDAE